MAADGKPGPVPTMTADAFRSMLPVVTGPDPTDVLAGQPLCVVELDDGPDVAALSVPWVVAGVRTGPTHGFDPPDLDLLLTDDPEARSPWVTTSDLDATIDELGTACRSSPLAALALVQLLRFGPQLSVADGLVAESFVYSMLQAGPEHRSWLAGRPPRSAPPAAETEPVAVDRHDDVLSILLDRPAVHNAYSAAMREALVSALQVAALDTTVRLVRMAGAGPSFCSGGDLSEFGTAGDPATAHAVRIGRGAAIWMDRCSDRTSVHVHGACIGAGVELAAFAHRVEADPDTYFRLPEVAMGLVPGAGGTVSLPRRVGRQRAAYLAIGGADIDAATAARWGLVDAVAARRPGWPL